MPRTLLQAWRWWWHATPITAGELDAALDKLDGFEYTMILALWVLCLELCTRIQGGKVVWQNAKWQNIRMSNGLEHNGFA